MSRRVVVTGMAGLCPLGADWKSAGDALRSGRSAVTRLPEWDEIEGLAVKIGAPVPEFAVPPDEYPRKKTRAMGRLSLLATRASDLALRDAGLRDDPVLSSGRAGVAYGSSNGSPPAIGVYARQLFVGKTIKGIAASDYLQIMSHTCAANIAAFFGLRGRVIPTCSACTSGSQGIGYAYETIKHGMQDVMIGGGAEELHAIDGAIFGVLFAASTRNAEPQRTPRPFDLDRDGMVCGEGAATLVLEELERARARGARIHAEVVGYATNCDGRHLTNPDPSGMQQVMSMGLADAGVPAEAIGYVSAHGTGTEAGDIAESRATFEVFGDRVPVSTQKGHFGHTLGACGAIESWLAIEMMREGWFAPTLNLESLDPRCAPLDYIQGEPRRIEAEWVANHNFAFGGVNTSLIFRRWA